MSYHLFPFDKVPKNSRIILYGAGNVGKQFYNQVTETNFCEIVLWLDKNADGILVKQPATFTNLNIENYDFVVIAIENKTIANDVKIFFTNYKVPESKIIHYIHHIIKPAVDDNYWRGTKILNEISIEQIKWEEKQDTSYNEIDFTSIEFFDEDILIDVEKYLFGKIEGTNYNKSEMTHKERAFLNGLIRKAKPKTIVEIGTSAGASASVILNAIRDMESAKLYSFDYNTIWYRDNGNDHGRKTGFLVNQIVPDLASKWELYTNGVPCKYFDNIPKDGIDICFIDTVHFNPGEHLNVLEVLPFMKKNGIIIYHDVAYHTNFNASGITNHISINSLNGKRILLKSEQTMGLASISAIILNDENFESMIFALFSNLNLPWNYKISDDDFIEMFRHFSKYYSQEMVQIYLYYCSFYMNGGMQNKKIASIIAEKEIMNFQNQRLLNNNKKLNKKPIVAMINCDKNDGNPSETFIKLQRYNIDAKVNYYNDGIPPTKINEMDLMTPYVIAQSEIYEKKSNEMSLSHYEILVAMSLINENTDVVFAQFGNVGAEIMKICKKINLPLIVHFHGFDISVKTLIENYKEKYQEMFEYATYIIAVSKCMRNMLINLGCCESKIIYNPCIANDTYYSIRPAYNKKLFIGAGRFVPKKAPQNTILAFIKVLEKHPDAKLILAGEGELLETCKELVKQNRIEKSVFLPGTFNMEQLKLWLSEAMAFVQHSITAPNGDMEGTPVVICEASLAGLPVISTFHAGIPDVIIDGKTGLLVKEGDIEGMAKNMTWILDNPEKAKEIGTAGKENIWKNFNMKKHIKVLDEIIYKAAGKA